VPSDPLTTAYFKALNIIVERDKTIQKLAEELHKAINEPMYAGTRQDWIDRATSAELEVKRLNDIIKNQDEDRLKLARSC
jgi:hypothetical protein